MGERGQRRSVTGLAFCVTIPPTIDAVAALAAVARRSEYAGPYQFVVHVEAPRGILTVALDDVSVDGFNPAFREAVKAATGRWPRRHRLDEGGVRGGPAAFAEALDLIDPPDPDDGSGHEWGEVSE